MSEQGAPVRDETADRTSVITARLKTIYRKSVYPVEKRYKYDYFYESPLMTDVEFDGEYLKQKIRTIDFCNELMHDYCF
jgi:hypothetical protein